MISDSQILQAVENTRSQWVELLTDQEAADLEQWLAEAAVGDPEIVRQAANRVLELLPRYPEARARVTDELGIRGGLESLRLYSPPPGEHEPPTSILMVCPKDPDHYRKRLRQKGQVLYCPTHGVPLVPVTGEPSTIASSIEMVCPEDPAHCPKKWLRQKGKELRCHKHGVPLVPADSIEAKE